MDNLPAEFQVRLRLPATEEFYSQNILEAYDGMVLIMACQRQGEMVEMLLSSSRSFQHPLEEVLADLAREVGLTWQKEPAA